MLAELMNALQQGSLQLTPPLHALKIAGSQGADRKVNFLIFAANQATPNCVAKMLRTPSDAPRLREEFATQQQLYAHMGASIPQPLAILDILGETVFVESAITGEALSILMQRDKHRNPPQVQADLYRVIDWLAEFQKKTMLSETLPLTLEGVGEVEMPLVGCHGDFWAGNLFLAGDQLGVIDWEDYQTGILPTRDAFFFLTTYALSFQTKMTKEAAFRYAFLNDNWFSFLLHKVVYHYFSTLGVPSELIAPLFLHFLQDMAYGGDHSQARKGLQARWQNTLKLYQAESAHSIWAK